MSTRRFQFASSNLSKLLAIPKYVLSWLLAFFVPRVPGTWAFGSGIGVGEGALALARELRDSRPDARIVWLVADETEGALAEAESFTPVVRRSRHGFWATLRAETLVVTHGLGDVNRFGVFGGTVVQLWHGAPLKRIHLDSAVTTAVRGPAPLRGVLQRMYARGTKQVSLYVAGSVTAAERLRSAFRVAPGKVAVLGDPRDDELAAQAADPAVAAAARERVLDLLAPQLQSGNAAGSLVLYAPTWRDGEADPAIPTDAEVAEIVAALARVDARLVIRSHPLGEGEYGTAVGDRIHLLGGDIARDITPLLGAFDAVITDFSSIAVDFSLLERPIQWFAPDLEAYTATRGLYEALEVTAGSTIARSWGEVTASLSELLTAGTPARREASRAAAAIAARFHPHRDGNSARRVLAAIERLRLPASELVEPGGVFFESFYGRQVSCNPLALDREIAARYPELPRYWSVTSERQDVPAGATAVLVGGVEWFAARRMARLLIVNDWLRFGFKRGPDQIVLQTWHGTMLKHLALGRPNVSLRTKLAIKRESRRWSMLLSQNGHSTDQFRSSYAFDGEILETGYPRDDRLAVADLAGEMNPVASATARQTLGIPDGRSVIVYAPTWRDRGTTVVDALDVNALADALGEDWIVVARGHTRTHELGSYLRLNARVIDATAHPDINDVILAADLLVTDYSSVMFDAAVAGTPLAFYVPDLAEYRDAERGFTFDFEASAPGPLLQQRDELLPLAAQVREHGRAAPWIADYRPAYAAWQARFTPHDDGAASARVVDRLAERGAFGAAIERDA
ncbi:CDP-glycerol glycerophosphotransferase family protein [Leucobacter aridicollis]|uniref:CDP-glycerol glycerophosphotransferase family protein n=1 Tax=Leucobacter aridicollis TaxID=283878 RepID=UPI00216714A0|nr:CDP-glycerol glycerophosphotransferase family protein [Leucobacter aridicollis]MCS3427965.1 CDP-glycerol glycerophosphotransferase (TagB/SpsB family) [Leucobacter aridicollis]